MCPSDISSRRGSHSLPPYPLLSHGPPTRQGPVHFGVSHSFSHDYYLSQGQPPYFLTPPIHPSPRLVTYFYLVLNPDPTKFLSNLSVLTTCERLSREKKMGCCIGKTPARQPPKPSDSPPRLPPPLSHPTPSPIPLEEEAVKEVVLSETPPPAPLPRPPEEDDSPPVAMRPRPLPSPLQPKLAPQVFGQPLTPRKLDAAKTDILISKLEEAAEVVSEYSDMYTLSGSLSLSTTPTTGTAATLNDSEVTSKVSRSVARTPPNRAPRKRPPVVGRDERPDRGAGSHARRLQQTSPDRGRIGAAPGRDLGGVRRNAGQAGRDLRRRSSSPAWGRAGDGFRGGMGKSPSKRTGSAGSRSSSSTGPGTENGSNPQRRKKRETEEDGKDGRNRNDVRGGNENDNAAWESLENPHVSLECFIFL